MPMIASHFVPHLALRHRTPLDGPPLTRPLVWFSAPFGLTLLMAGKLPVWLVALLGCAALCVLLRLPRQRGSRPWTVALSVTLALGWFLLFWSGVSLVTRDYVGTRRPFSATVTQDSTQTAYGISVRAVLQTRHGLEVPVLLYRSETTPLHPGDIVTGTAEFTSGMVQDQDDLTSWASDGLFLVGSVADGSTVASGTGQQLRFLPQTLRREVQGRIDTLFDETGAALLRALLTGDRGSLSHDYTDALQRTGLSHLFAVSGLHVSFLVSLFALLTGNNRWCGLLCLPALVLFCLMTGGSPSIVRATLMAALFLMAPFLGREADGATSLAAALLLLLLQNPFSAGNLGLQLSFASMLGILQVTPRLFSRMTRRLSQPRPHLWQTLRRLVYGSLATTVGASVLTVPLVAYYFGYLSLIAPLSNLLMLEVAALLFSLGTLAVLVSFLWMPLGQVLAWLLQPLEWYVMNLPMLLRSVPFAALSDRFQLFYLWIVACCLIGLLTLCSQALRRRPYLPGGAAALLLVVSLALFQVEMGQTGLLFQALDVGQGQCLLFYSGGACFAIDCGGNGEAGAELASALRDLQETKLEGLALTHYDRDHCNGVEELLQTVEVETLYLPDVVDDSNRREEIVQAAAGAGVPIQWVTQDQTVSFGQATVSLYPPMASGGEDNEQCLTACCHSGPFDVLVTGDLDAGSEEDLVAAKGLQDIEVLVAAHHGSRYATSAAFLAAIDPTYAVISVGGNPYGHPTQEVLERLDEAGCSVFRTDLNGTVSIRYQEE